MEQETNVCASCVPEVKEKPWWILIEETPKWLRVKVNDAFIADSKHALIVDEAGRLPIYYFPFSDLNQKYLIPSDSHMETKHKGTANFYSIQVGDQLRKDAIWYYPDPLPESAGLKGYAAINWKSADHWYEEEEEVFVHARDPYSRIDTLPSSRHIQVILNGVTVADSTRPVILFETGLTPRYYLPKEDIRFDFLEPSDLTTRCPYKGIASYWSANVNGKKYENILWSYQDPVPELPKIKGLYSFYNEKVDSLIVDGKQWHLKDDERLPYNHDTSDLGDRDNA